MSLQEGAVPKHAQSLQIGLHPLQRALSAAEDKTYRRLTAPLLFGAAASIQGSRLLARSVEGTDELTLADDLAHTKPRVDLKHSQPPSRGHAHRQIQDVHCLSHEVGELLRGSAAALSQGQSQVRA